MAGRVNTKFVFILSTVLIVLVGGIIAVSQITKRDVDDYVMRAEQYIADGDYDLGVETMRRAVNNAESDPEIIKKYIDTVKIAPVDDYVEASNSLETIRGNTLHVANIVPDSEQYLREYAELITGWVDQVGIINGVHPLYIYHAARSRLEANPDDQLARRYRAIYGLILVNTEMNQEDIDRVRDDVHWTYQQNPDDPEAVFAMARWKLFESRLEERPGGDAKKAEQLRDEAIELVSKQADADPNNPERQLEHLQILAQTIRTTAGDEDPYAPLKPELEKLEQKLLNNPQPFEAVALATQYLKRAYAKDVSADTDATGLDAKDDGTKRAVALLRLAAKTHPDEARYQLLLGSELKQAGEYEAAQTYLDKVRNLSTQGNFLQVLLNQDLKSKAQTEYADLLITLAELTQDPDERKAKYNEAGKIIDQAIAAGRGEEPRMLLLKGRHALAQGNVREGLVNIDRAVDGYDAMSYEKAQALMLSARARSQQGDWGAASQRYEELLRVLPGNPALRLEVTKTYIRARRFDDAQDQLDAVLIENPSDERALIMQAALQAEQGNLDQAIQTYRRLDLPNRPDLAVGLAQIMIRGDRKDQAVAMMKKYYDVDPTNLGVLAILLTAADDPDQRAQLIAKSRQAGADADQLDRIEQQLAVAETGDVEKMVDFVVGTNPEADPFVREISKMRMYAQAGNEEKAREALAKAAELKPDDKAVVSTQFNYAIRDGDLALAQRLADKAATLNLDEAQGLFYLSQLQIVRENYAGAIDNLRTALDMVPISSDGWRMLGDAYAATNNQIEAVNAYEKSMQQKPDNLATMRGLVSIRDKQGRNDEALSMLRVGHQQYPQNAALTDLYLSYEAKHGNKQTALRLRREIQQTQPGNTNNLRALALLLAQMGQSDEGVSIMRTIIESEGSSTLNAYALASVYQAAGDADSGAAELQRFIRSRGAEATSSDYILLARYLLQNNDPQGALNAYQQAKTLETDKLEVTRELATLFFSRGAYDRAVALYRELYEKFPQEQGFGLRLADALIRSQQIDEGEEILNKLNASATKDALLALIAQARGQSEEAIRLVNRAIEADSGKAVFYYERAAFRIREQDADAQILDDLNTALTLDPNHIMSRKLLVNMHLRRNERREAYRELNTLLTRHPEDKQGRLQLIRMHLQDNEVTRARALAREGTQIAENEPTWYAVLGDIEIKQGNVGPAIQAYSKVFELVPNAVQLLNLTTIQIENGRAADAQKLLRDNASIVNDQPMLQAVMGRALYATNKPDEARQLFLRAAERCSNLQQFYAVATQVRKDYSLDETVSLLKGMPNPPSTAWVELTLARLEITEGTPEAAISRLKALESTLASDDEATRQAVDQSLAPALHQAGQSEQALVYYKRLYEQMPENPSVLNNMAYLLAEDLNRPAEALPMAEKAKELEPNNAQVLDTLGWIQFKLGQHEDARATLLDSITKEPLAANHLHLAELLLVQGRRSEARSHLQTAIDLAEQSNDTPMLERARKLLQQSEELTEASVNP